MIKKHNINYKISEEVFKKCKDFLETKQCYTNIFHTVFSYRDKYINGEWKITYGYIKPLENHNLMARHCFIVNEENEAIDPTLFTQSTFNINNSREYFSFYIFDNINTYIKAVEKNDNIPDLIKPLLKVEEKFSDAWANENNYILIK